MGGRIKVMVVDDHSIVRTGLVSLLGAKKGIEVVGEAADGEAAVAKAVRSRPDVIVMDLMMPKKDGAATTAEIRRRLPDAKVLILTSFGSSDGIQRALDAGANGVILKSSSNAELVNTIREIADGKRMIADDVEQLLAKDPPVPELSPRQAEILESVARGLTNQETAKRFGISPNSVKRHLQILFNKIGAANRSEAATIALRKHLLKI